MTDIFTVPATADLLGVHSVGELATREGFTSVSEYSTRFADALCSSGSLDAMRERFIALASAAGNLDADRATAQEVTAMFVILEALFRKLIIQSVEVAGSGQRGSSEAAERLLSGAFKAQKSAVQCLSALKVLREGAPPSPPTTTATGVQDSGVGAGSLPASLALSGKRTNKHAY